MIKTFFKKASEMVTVVGRIMAPKDIHVLILENWLCYFTLQGGIKGADGITVAIQLAMRWEEYFVLPPWADVIARVLKNGRGREKGQRQAGRCPMKRPGPVCASCEDGGRGYGPSLQKLEKARKWNPPTPATPETPEGTSPAKSLILV